jgi:hypothetical protein
MGRSISGWVCYAVQGRRRLGIMKRNGAELMRRWEERRRMCGRWTKRSRRIWRRLLKEVNGGTNRRQKQEMVEEEEVFSGI